MIPFNIKSVFFQQISHNSQMGAIWFTTFAIACSLSQTGGMKGDTLFFQEAEHIQISSPCGKIGSP